MRNRRFLVAILLSVSFVLFVGLPSYVLSNYYYHLDTFSSHVRNRDVELARKELIGFDYFHAMAQRWKLSWLTDRYIFKEAPLYNAAYDILMGDNKRAISRLEDVKENYRADHIRGIARFRNSKDLYEVIKSDESKKSVLKTASPEISRDFERAIRNGPDSNFDDRYNYDITSDEESLKRAFESQGLPRRFILGFEGGGKEPAKPGGKKGDPRKRINEESTPGSGAADKKG